MKNNNQSPRLIPTLSEQRIKEIVAYATDPAARRRLRKKYDLFRTFRINLDRDDEGFPLGPTLLLPGQSFSSAQPTNHVGVSGWEHEHHFNEE